MKMLYRSVMVNLLYVYFSRISTDGNCLYNAVSMYLNNTEELHLILRLLTTIEMFLNWNYYASVIERMVAESKVSQNKLAMIKTMFRFTSADNLTSVTDLCNAFLLEAMSNCDVGSFSSMACIFGLASVIGQPIRSLYTPRVNAKLFSLFSQVVQPRIKSSENAVLLLWSSTQPPSKYQRPNHFVVCLDLLPSKRVKLLPPKKRK